MKISTRPVWRGENGERGDLRRPSHGRDRAAPVSADLQNDSRGHPGRTAGAGDAPALDPYLGARFRGVAVDHGGGVRPAPGVGIRRATGLVARRRDPTSHRLSATRSGAAVLRLQPGARRGSPRHLARHRDPLRTARRHARPRYRRCRRIRSPAGDNRRLPEHLARGDLLTAAGRHPHQLAASARPGPSPPRSGSLIRPAAQSGCSSLRQALSSAGTEGPRGSMRGWRSCRRRGWPRRGGAWIPGAPGSSPPRCRGRSGGRP